MDVELWHRKNLKNNYLEGVFDKYKIRICGGRYMITQIGFLRKGDVFTFEGNIYKVGHLLESTNGYVSCIDVNTGKKKRLHIDVDVEIEQAN